MIDKRSKWNGLADLLEVTANTFGLFAAMAGAAIAIHGLATLAGLI